MTLGGMMRMLTVIILMLMEGTDGPPLTMLPNTGLQGTVIKGCEGEDKLLLTKEQSAHGEILTYEWVYNQRNASFSTTNKMLCYTVSGGFKVNPSYHGKVEQCDTMGILLKNISLHDMGYYKLQFLSEKMERNESRTIFHESRTIFLTVSDTPKEQCKPVIRNYSGNMLKCSAPCEHFGLEWRLNKTGQVVGNESVLPIDCLWTNEVILCCLQGQAIECYKGGQSELCTQTTPSYCTENTPGENGSDIHTFKDTTSSGDGNNNKGTTKESPTAAPAPNNTDNNWLGFLALLIIPGILAVVCVFHWNKIKSWIMMCQNRRNKYTPSSPVKTQEIVHLLEVKVETYSTPTLEVKEEADSTPTQLIAETFHFLEEKEGEVSTSIELCEQPVPQLATKPAASSSPIQLHEETLPQLEKKEAEDSTPPQPSDPEHETVEATTEHQPSTDSETLRELQELRVAARCKICYVKEMNMVFMPCKHVATCASCSVSLQQCPLCRAFIEGKMNIRFD